MTPVGFTKEMNLPTSVDLLGPVNVEKLLNMKRPVSFLGILKIMVVLGGHQ